VPQHGHDSPRGADQAILDGLHKALDDRTIAAAIYDALVVLKNGQAQSLDRRMDIERELSLLEAQGQKFFSTRSRPGSRGGR
jgi:hypothetical protein